MFCVGQQGVEPNKNTHSELTEVGAKNKENNMTEEYTYKFDKEQLEARAKDWFRLLEQASCEGHNSNPVLSDSDLDYIANLLNKHTRMKWLMPLIIETAIDEGEIDEF